MKAGDNKQIGWFKRSPDGAPNPNFLQLAVPLTVGKFADYLIKKKIKVSTCHSYLLSPPPTSSPRSLNGTALMWPTNARRLCGQG
jgi:hypothetical protein